jgi:quercetin dioxygenase-like cupin family protein
MESDTGLNMMRLLMWDDRIAVANSIFSAGTKYPTHQHPGYEIVVVYKGKIELDIGGKKITITDCGKPYYFDASQPHSADVIEDTELIAITIPGDRDWKSVVYG